MIDALLNTHKLAAQGIAERTASARYGVIQSIDPANHAAKVTVEPEGVLTGWLPIKTTAIGNGWGIVSLPAPGTQVQLLPQEGDGEEWAVAGAVFDTEAMPPSVPSAIDGSNSNAQPGEHLIVGQAGNVLRLCADGSVFVLAPVNIQGNVVIAGNLTVWGDMAALGTYQGSSGQLKVAGEIYDLNAAHSSLDTLRQDYNGHVHPDVYPGSSDTGTTTKPTP